MFDRSRLAGSLAAAVVGLTISSGSASAATYYVGTNGSNSSSCGTSSAPCASPQYVLDNKVAAGDTIVINSGTYSGGLNIANASRHARITITTTDAVKSSLGAFKRGIPTGTDNRPMFSAGSMTIAKGVTGVVVEYIRMRYSATPQSGWVMTASIYEPGNTIRYSELWNATAIGIFTTGPLTFSQNYLHDSGVADGDDPDTHTLFVCRNSGCGGDRRADPTSWNQKILIEHTTFGGQSDGDQIQLSTGDDATGRDSYIEISNVDFVGTKVDEQMLDSKGSDYVLVHDSNFFSASGNSAADLSQPIDFVSSDLPSRNWWIYNNVFRPAGTRTYQAINMGHGSGEDYFWIWNNVFYNVEKYAWPQGDQRMIGTWNGMAAHMTFVHNTVLSESITAPVNLSYVSAERSDSIIRNNLFYNVFQTSGDSGAIFTGRGNSAQVSHNYFDKAGCPSGQCTNGSNAVINATNPLVDAVNGDYRPNAGTSVVNAGYTGLADNGYFKPSLDKNGNPRGSSPDIGALEAGSAPGGGGGGGTQTQAPQAPTNLRIVQ